MTTASRPLLENQTKISCTSRNSIWRNGSPVLRRYKLPECRTRPRRLPLGVRSAATRQPPRHGSGIEIGGLAAHGANVERSRLNS